MTDRMRPAMTRRALLGAAAALLAPGAAPLAAETFPSKPIRIVVPFTPGGTVDLVGRLVGKKLGEQLGQAMVVDNRGGASGAIGTVVAATAPADGYTILVGSTTTITILPQLKASIGYDALKDFVPLALVAEVPHVIVVNPGLPVRTIPDLIAYAKSRKDPLATGDSGVGTPHYLAMDIFRHRTGIELLHVPYKGGGAVLTDIVSGQIQAGSVEQTVATPLIESGQLRAIGISAAARSPVMPDLPTVAEQGIPGYEITSWYGLFAHAATPPDILARLTAESVKAVQAPETRDGLARVGATVMGSSGPEARRFVERELAKWGEAIRMSGLRLED